MVFGTLGLFDLSTITSANVTPSILTKQLDMPYFSANHGTLLTASSK